MAKATVKTDAPKTTKAATSKSKSPSATSIEKASEDALKKLQELGIEQPLQAEIEWCLGSYRFDGNPAGLYEKAAQALAVFQAEKNKKTKGVTAKFVTDLEKAIAAREAGAVA